ncbi:MAG: sulfite exporter TauE/SafE family protein [Bacteroidota bacterium]|nr:sulfite exporter TauE/SafE family protein [Bacteroidota bacterium]
MEYLGYFAAVLIGISLGLIGAGGSILTIPVLVYLIGIPAIHATSYSLFIVGAAALIGSLRYLRYNLICLKTVLVFGLPSVFSIFLTRKYILHSIPDQLIIAEGLSISKNSALMILLAALMILASISMIRKSKVIRVDGNRSNQQYSTFLIFQQGIIIGALVGLVGAGGGFLIIPALVILAKLPMKKAVGSSLAIVAINSIIGFLSDFGVHDFNWNFILIFSGCAIFGVFLGGYFSKFISSVKLKPAFGWFILIMALYILGKELLSGSL